MPWQVNVIGTSASSGSGSFVAIGIEPVNTSAVGGVQVIRKSSLAYIVAIGSLRPTW